MSIREITRAELDRCIRRCGADENLQNTLRELDAEEVQENARRVLRRYAADEALQEARQRQARLTSIAESPVWKDQAFLNKLSRDFMARDFEKSRETTKHYIDSAKQPATGPKSRMGIPRRGADGRVTWDTSAESDRIAEFDPASANLRKAQQGSLQNCGQCAHYNQEKTCQIVTGPVSSDLTCDKFGAIPVKPVSLMTADGKINPNVSRMGHPKLGLDGQITWEVNDEPKSRRVNVRADGKIDATKSIMGTPKLNPDGSITWA